MYLDILGCSGGIARGQKTTCLMMNDQWLIDAGTGVEQLTLEQLKGLKGVFLTHAHMDHICCLPMLLPIVNYPRGQKFQIYARSEVINALQRHIFNEVIWADFSRIPTADTSCIEFCPLAANSPRSFGEFTVTGIPVTHPSPAFGYLVTSQEGAFAFTGDCHDSPDFWQTVAQQPKLCNVLVDLSFPESYEAVAKQSGHYTPSSLQRDLSNWPEQLSKPVISISHLKTGFEQVILQEARERIGHDWSLQVLKTGDRITF